MDFFMGGFVLNHTVPVQTLVIQTFVGTDEHTNLRSDVLYVHTQGDVSQSVFPLSLCYDKTCVPCL